MLTRRSTWLVLLVVAAASGMAAAIAAAPPGDTSALALTRSVPGALAVTRGVPGATPVTRSVPGALAVTMADETRAAVVSPIWAGYVAGDGPYESVSGTFDVPRLDATPFGSMVYEWVGLDSGPLIQAGVAGIYDPVTRRATYQAWWEVFPDEPVIRPIDTVPVRPGDRIKVAISHVTGSTWRITVANITLGTSFATDQPYFGPHNTADWIVEAASSPQGGVLPLAAFRPAVTFRDLRVAGPVTSMTPYKIATGGVTVAGAAPGAMTPSGFTVAYVPPPWPLPPVRVTRILLGTALDLPVSGGIPGEPVDWEVSTDLSRWRELSTATFDDRGTALLTVQPFRTEFFRVHLPTTGEYRRLVTGVQVILSPAVFPSPPSEPPVPAPTVSATVRPSPSPTVGPGATPSPGPIASPSPSSSPGPTVSPSPSPSSSPGASPIPSAPAIPQASPGPSASPTPTPSPTPTGSIGGVVFGPDGRPAGGIQVAAQRFPESGFDSTVTTSDGTYGLRRLRAGTYRILVRDTTGRLPTGFVDGSRLTPFGPLASTVTVGKGDTEVDVRLPAGHTIAGRVLAAGDPIASLRVSVCSAENAFLPETFTAACAGASTASDGTYAIAVLRGPVTVRTADTDTYASTYYAESGSTRDATAATVLDAASSDLGGIDIALAPKPREGIVFGFVSASDGSRLSGIVVGTCSTTVISDCSYATTDATGFYADRVPAGTYSVAVIDPSGKQPSGFYGTDGFTAVPEEAAIVTVVPDVARQADVHVPAGHTVSGILLGADGRPMTNIIVTPCASPSCGGQGTATGEDGSYKLRLAPGTYTLNVMDPSGSVASGYVTRSGLADAAHALRLTIGGFDAGGLDLVLSRPSATIAPGVTRTGSFESGHVVVAGRHGYVTARIAVGRGFAGRPVAIEVSRRSPTGVWASFRRVTARLVAPDGYAYYSFRPSGWMAVRGALRDAVTSASTSISGFGDVVVRSGAVVARGL